ncbi:MAG: hypothetical protein JWM21_2724 [Acidobacteria bacterium]|nr:hypothetical protein [Acidobacteriota bacterium]
MSVAAAQPMMAISIPITHRQTELVDSIPNALAASSDLERALLIETIGRNVMAWTRWGGSERSLEVKLSGRVD